VKIGLRNVTLCDIWYITCRKILNLGAIARGFKRNTLEYVTSRLFIWPAFMCDVVYPTFFSSQSQNRRREQNNMYRDRLLPRALYNRFSQWSSIHLSLSCSPSGAATFARARISFAQCIYCFKKNIGINDTILGREVQV